MSTLLCTHERLRKPAGFVYVLACVGDRFYVGFSCRLAARLRQHFDGEGAEFTKRYEPLKLVAQFPAQDERHEFALFKQYVTLYGLHRVGGWNKPLAMQHGFRWPYQDKHYESFIKSSKARR